MYRYLAMLFIGSVSGFSPEISRRAFFMTPVVLGGATPSSIVHENGNHIYFYSPVTQESCFELNTKLVALEFKSNQFAAQYGVPPPPIHLHIQSEGGSLLHGLYVTDLIREMQTPVYTYIDGFAASAATLLSIVGHKRFMTPHSMMLIHQLSSSSSGKYAELQDEMENFDSIMRLVVELYQTHTKINPDELDELLRKDIWLDATRCLEYGLVDKVI